MNLRDKTRPVKVRNLQLGGNDHIYIQSMCNIKTSKVTQVSEQINRCAALGAEIMRLSVLDLEDAEAIKQIKGLVNIPLVADIHYSYILALKCIESGIDAIRINPGNMGKIEHIKLVVEACKDKNIPIRIGVNSGSIDQTITTNKTTAIDLVNSASKHVKILEDLGFYDIVISLKASSVIETIEAYKIAAEKFIYPLHIGITEAGTKDIGTVRSVAGIAPLLLAGIGNTIRISLSDEPEEEIKVCNRLLKDLNLKIDYPTMISCPTCGRTQVNLVPLAEKIFTYLEENNINISVAIMGCAVNGPGEAKHADIGVAGNGKTWQLFKKGEVIREIADNDVYNELIKEINNL